MSYIKDHTGTRFGRLVAISRHRTGGITRYVCVCDCGGSLDTAASHLVSGNTRSCGCLLKEQVGDRFRTHGLHKTPTYRIWAGMLSRCRDPKNHGYADYGGRGITVCNRWLVFENFFEDMGPRPDGLTLEREDNEKGYCKENCVWASAGIQARNRRNTVRVSLHGTEMTAAEAARALGLWKGTLHRWMKSGKPLPEGLVRI